ncbi:arsenate reductase ArsC [Carboxydochorda subterranea]|uniref:Arsenate reductase ArsC n=1 Tax=Carboxydichorda subterranea TaxID=3109565 RepID=A0ABZ1BWJ4_9FIRM|nr:arsenate reductase ArsC [Limnochorda sp. L945t]WRP17164.1 arsenate reductase ArsC [Limnochorda sp. L945t]
MSADRLQSGPAPSPFASPVPEEPRVRILFVCTGNSARSQMAEGFGRALGEGIAEARSAGLEPKGLHPYAVRAMAEVGIDISQQRSKLLSMEDIRWADVVVTLCGDARDRCPVLPPGTRSYHWPLPDPAAARGSEADVLAVFRAVRDEIERDVRQLLASLAAEKAVSPRVL